MKRKTVRLALLVLIGGAWGTARAQVRPEAPRRPVSTYSIVARDPATGAFGVAVQSHWFSVGPVVPWAEAGVGAVATQSLVDVSYGPLGLALMRAGKSAPEALRALVSADAHPEIRQVAMVDARGRVATHTGERCIAEAGHAGGEGYSVQANLMESNRVWPAMARAYEAAGGDFAGRLLAALEAAQDEGGDIRGRQSAAILIVKGASCGRPWEDTLVDLRVEDSPDPLGELRRLLEIQRAYDFMNQGDLFLETEDYDEAFDAYARAADMLPDRLEPRFWWAVAMVTAGGEERVQRSLALFEAVFAANRKWADLVPRLPASGLLPDDPALIERILSVAP